MAKLKLTKKERKLAIKGAEKQLSIILRRLAPIREALIALDNLTKSEGVFIIEELEAEKMHSRLMIRDLCLDKEANVIRDDIHTLRMM